MPANNLSEGIQWTEVPVGVGAAAGSLQIRIGSVGQGKPVALITAGIHGDEGPWGAWAIRKFLDQTPRADLLGTLRVVPLTNPLAMEADARCAPLDVLDLNRVFPGNPKGSHTERLAAILAEHAVKGVDTLIDLHGGGSWCVNAFVHRNSDALDLADAFGAPFASDTAARAATNRGMGIGGYARSLGARITGVEMGGRSPDEEKWAQRIATGLRRALSLCGVLKPDPSIPPPAKTVAVKQTTVLRPAQGGILLPAVDHTRIGTLVPQGTLLGSLMHPATFDVLEEFRAPYAQTAILLLRPTMARLEAGAMTYVVSEPL
jgi:predicted deacylase